MTKAGRENVEEAKPFAKLCPNLNCALGISPWKPPYHSHSIFPPTCPGPTLLVKTHLAITQQHRSTQTQPSHFRKQRNECLCLPETSENRVLPSLLHSSYLWNSSKGSPPALEIHITDIHMTEQKQRGNPNQPPNPTTATSQGQVQTGTL